VHRSRRSVSGDLGVTRDLADPGNQLVLFVPKGIEAGHASKGLGLDHIDGKPLDYFAALVFRPDAVFFPRLAEL
jgi:hypothetical protein